MLRLGVRLGHDGIVVPLPGWRRALVLQGREMGFDTWGVEGVWFWCQLEGSGWRAGVFPSRHLEYIGGVAEAALKAGWTWIFFATKLSLRNAH